MIFTFCAAFPFLVVAPAYQISRQQESMLSTWPGRPGELPVQVIVVVVQLLLGLIYQSVGAVGPGEIGGVYCKFKCY